MKFKEGEYVRVISREATPDDAKNGTYYPHFGGLAGVVDKIYEKEVVVKVDDASLPEEILKRHLDIQESMKKKWLNGLSGEARNRLSPEERQFSLSYTILVQVTDLEKASPGEGVKAPSAKKPAPKVESPDPEPVAPKAESAPAEPKPKAARAEPAPKAPKAEKPAEGEPADTNGMSAAEIAFLKEREKAMKKK